MKILLIDDEEDVRDVAGLSLGLVGGMDVHTAASGAEGIAAAREVRPDAILMDRMMPGLDGQSTFAELRGIAELAAVPIIFLTASAMPADVDEMLRMGAAGVIVKPFDPMTLAAQVKSILERR